MLIIILEIALYPLTISQHADKGSVRFIIPYEQEIAKSFIVGAKTESPKSIIDSILGFNKSLDIMILLSYGYYLVLL